MLPSDLNIPPVDSAALPAEVRNGTPQDRQLYSVALSFERMLVEQLTQQMTQSSSLLGSDDGDDSDDGDEQDDTFGAASNDLFTQQLPGAMADAIAGGGGIGLADELFHALQPTATQAPADQPETDST
jgi:Rod binding domain-containing protein